MEKTNVNKFITPGKVKDVNLSITTPENAGLRFILNLCAPTGKLDTNSNKILVKRWKKVNDEYKSWFANQTGFALGAHQTVAVQSDIWIINMLVLDKDGKLSLEHFKKCVKKVFDLTKYEKASAHVSSLDLNEGLKQALVDTFSAGGIHIYFYNGDKLEE